MAQLAGEPAFAIWWALYVPAMLQAAAMLPDDELEQSTEAMVTMAAPAMATSFKKRFMCTTCMAGANNSNCTGNQSCNFGFCEPP